MVALAGFVGGAYFGYDYGSTKAYNVEHAKTEECTELRARDEKQTLELSNTEIRNWLRATLPLARPKKNR